MTVKTDDLVYRVAVERDKRLLHLDDFVSDLSWEEVDGQLPQRCSINLVNEKAGDRRIAQLLPNGANVRIQADDSGKIEERFRGTVFANHSSWSTDRTHEVTGYDALYYWLLSEDDVYFKAGLTGAEMLKHLAQKWNIPVGTIAGPNEDLGKKAFRGLTIGAMAERILHDSRSRGGGRWLLRAEKGKVSTVRRGTNDVVWHFEEDSILTVDVDRSIESLVTSVKIIGREKHGSKLLATATSDLVDDFGTFQRILSRADYHSPAAAKKAAFHVLRSEGKEQKTRTVVAPDVPGVRRGDRHFFQTATLDGYYIVSSVFHDAPTRSMTLELSEIDPDEIDINFKDFHLEDWIPPDQSDAGLGSPGAAQPAAWKAIVGQLQEGFTSAGRHDLAAIADSDDFFTWTGAESGHNPGAVSPANNNGLVNGGLVQFWAGHSWAVPYFSKGTTTPGSAGNRFTMSVQAQAVAMCTRFTLTVARIQGFAAQIRSGTYGGWG